MPLRSALIHFDPLRLDRGLAFVNRFRHACIVHCYGLKKRCVAPIFDLALWKRTLNITPIIIMDLAGQSAIYKTVYTKIAYAFGTLSATFAVQYIIIKP